jgi:hypothetical protein
MKIIRSKEYRAGRAWGAQDIANMNGVTTRLQWTDQPYRWHTNDFDEVFGRGDPQRMRCTSFSLRSFHSSASGKGALRLVMAGQLLRRASSAFSATMWR